MDAGGIESSEMNLLVQEGGRRSFLPQSLIMRHRVQEFFLSVIFVCLKLIHRLVSALVLPSTSSAPPLVEAMLIIRALCALTAACFKQYLASVDNKKHSL